MDPKPERLETPGEIWVGGWWPGFYTWALAKPGLVIINCQHFKFVGPNSFWLHVNNRQGLVDGKDWWQRHREAFWLVIQAIAQRRPVLIHCLHVLEPTGDFVSLCFALCMWMCRSPGEPWSDCLRRGCQERSAGVVARSGHPRNLAVEYWRATTDLYGALTPVDLRWLTESAASVESVASATAAQDIAHQARRSGSSSSGSNSGQSSSPPQLQQQQQDQQEEEEDKEEQEQDEHEEEQEEKQQEENEGEYKPWEEPPWKTQRVDIKPPWQAQPDDWICPTCGNHNWTRRGYCNGKHGGACRAPPQRWLATRGLELRVQ